MRRQLPKSVTIQVDTREQYPFPFDKMGTFAWYPDPLSDQPLILQIKVEPATMPEGDYCLKGLGPRCIVERKSGLSELTTNLLTADWARTSSAYGRLCAATANPWLVVEGSISELATPLHVRRNVPHPARVRDALNRAASLHNLQVAFIGRPTNRMLSAEFVLSLLLNETPWADEYRPPLPGV